MEYLKYALGHTGGLYSRADSREMGGIVYVIVTLGTVRILIGEQEMLGHDLATSRYFYA